MVLHSRISQPLQIKEPGIFRVREAVDGFVDSSEVLLVNEEDASYGPGALIVSRNRSSKRLPTLPNDLGYLATGDIVRLSPDGAVSVLYRKNSPHNSIFITERCNSRCVMCSQPPRDVDDAYLIAEWRKAIPLMSLETSELGITGGEPTLEFDGVLSLVESAKEHLPSTAVHMLTNGRRFSTFEFAKRLSALGHPDLMLGVPLYSDLDEHHDFVVQAKGAFDETVLGLVNLATVKQRIEIRVVIHRHTFQRLPQLSRFIARNFPFVEHVALMGLELMGFAKSNLQGLWIDPRDFQSELATAVGELVWGGLDVSIYNLPLCVLPEKLWPFARKSISDWKNVFPEPCNACARKELCCGCFASSAAKMNSIVQPFQ